MKIAHFADVHFRGLSRHDEYREVFTLAFEKLKQEKPDVIYIGGDIVHSKTQGITPELIEILTWWLSELAKIAPVDMILGNHDGLILNKDRQDAITPIVQALDNNRIRLFKQSDVYESPCAGFSWVVYSPFDEDGWKSLDDKINKCNVNIAFYHGAIAGSKSDLGMVLAGENEISLFKNSDFALLGDIHKRQFLNDSSTIAYCGSTIQQNYGEDTDKGFLVWDIKSKTEFDVKFVKVDNKYSFNTIKFKKNIENTLAEAALLSEKARIRYELEDDISDVTIHELTERTHRLKNYTEVTLKIDKSSSSTPATSKIEHVASTNFRDKATIIRVLDEYLSDRKADVRQKQLALKKFEKYYDDSIFEDDIARSVSWSINSLEFNNLYSYGVNNKINFDKLNGITGIFGQNRVGKSSIIGTIAYALFNTTDRGPMKNAHIVHIDEEIGNAKVSLTVNNEKYDIVRETIKTYNKKGDIFAPTTLSLKKVCDDGAVQNLNDEQRRETEKELRKLLGTSEDFSYTTLASQGQMNAFIDEKSTSRKQILNRFLDIDVFDTYLEKVKKDILPLKAVIKSTSTIASFEAQIIEYASELRDLNSTLDEKQHTLEIKKQEIKKYENENTEQLVSQEEIDIAKKLFEKIANEIAMLEKEINECNNNIENCNEKLDKIDEMKSVFNTDAINEEQKKLSDLELKYAINVKDHEAKVAHIHKLQKQASILDNVPCGSQFPSCVFIKDAFKGKSEVQIEQEACNAIKTTIDILQSQIEDILKNDIKSKYEKIKKIDELKIDYIQKKAKSESQAKIAQERLAQSKTKHEKIESDIEFLEKKRSAQLSEDLFTKNALFVDIKNSISKLEKEIIAHASAIGKHEEKISNTKLQIETLRENIAMFEVLQLLENAFSKKGIPQNILTKCLPSINDEIKKILTGISGFTVEIECDDANSIEIYLIYNDKRRIIELGSGMEKMIASIAIRVALTSISSLPKADMFIIDEGFGALDASNIDACARLLQNLKSYFRKILIISHIDSVKDIVDNTLVIEYNNNRSWISYE